ncbi:MAG: GDP-mannose 4,6-dehydratase, partial [Bacteroidota bacterium]
LNLISCGEGMWRILQHDTAEDFVLATGKTHTIREFCELAFTELDIDVEWHGAGIEEKGIVSSIDSSKMEKLISGYNHPIIQSSNLKLGSVLVSVSPKYFRPTEVDLLIGDASKAKQKLGWEAKTKLQELVHIMVLSDFNKVFEKGY